ncbi:hypothetical protein JMJ35_002820 [Cladonia borealis]|uniref:Small EDRK-rich factor-like N-terminal domain-containing protein n=1 Tax=Cladonia borealis TaxID=184061 RepID=A0AA39R3H4_9LECA|nr:hypothetical protein JMJ35_002820 [Cladonia borealis]
MARGNQRDKAREKNQKEQAGQKKKNTQSGTEFQRTKEQQAAIMRQKQAEEGPEEEIEIEKRLETNLMAAFAKKEAGSASSGGKK